MITPLKDSTILTYRGLTVRLSPRRGLYVYVLHAKSKLHHAQHYTGFTTNIDARLRLHRAGLGAKLTRAYNAHGIDYELAMLIPVGSCEEGHALERRLKAKHNASRYCPICRGQPLDDETFFYRHGWLPDKPQARPRRPMGTHRPTFVHRIAD